MKIVVVSGFFDPVGPHHIALFKEASKLGDYLIVGLNSDECALMKKRQPAFMPFEHRKIICENISIVDRVVGFNDMDGTSCSLLNDIYNEFKNSVDYDTVQIIFCNGGDRSGGTTPEEKYVKEKLHGKIEMVYGVGGFEKIYSSSGYLKDWVSNTMKKYNIDFTMDDKY